jgi:hypothetical protein
MIEFPCNSFVNPGNTLEDANTTPFRQKEYLHWKTGLKLKQLNLTIIKRIENDQNDYKNQICDLEIAILESTQEAALVVVR